MQSASISVHDSSIIPATHSTSSAEPISAATSGSVATVFSSAASSAASGMIIERPAAAASSESKEFFLRPLKAKQDLLSYRERLWSESEWKKILAQPQQYGLTQDALSYYLIQAGLKQEKEEKIKAQIMRWLATPSKRRQILEEKDTLYHQTPLHWCAIFNYPEIARELESKGFSEEDTNQAGFTHLQIAVLFAHHSYVMAHLRRLHDLSEVAFKLALRGKEVEFKLNVLHLAMLKKDNQLVQEICTLWESKQIPMNTEIEGIGNWIHWCVYVAIGHLSLTSHERKSAFNASELLQLVLQKSAITEVGLRKLLTEKGSNYERLTPLMLAAKYNQPGIIAQLVDALKLHVDSAQGLEVIQEAFYTAVREKSQEAVEAFWNEGFEHSNKHKDYDRVMEELTEKEKKNDPEAKAMKNKIHRYSRQSYFGQYEPSDPNTQIYENLVLSGGGGKGFAYPYALTYFQQYCDQRSARGSDLVQQQLLAFRNIKRVVGTSAGSIFALGLAIGFAPEEMQDKLSYDFENFLEGKELKALVKELGGEAKLTDILDSLLKALMVEIDQLKKTTGSIQESNYLIPRLLYEGVTHGVRIYKEIKAAWQKIQKINQRFTGFCSGEKAYGFLRDLLKDKKEEETLTFGELARKVRDSQGRYKHLHVVVTNLTRGTIEVLSSENSLYEHFLVIDAVRASMSFPLVFSPHKLRIKLNSEAKPVLFSQDEYVDGGMLRNYAIDEFDFKKYTDADAVGDTGYPEINKRTIGFRFKELTSVPSGESKEENLLSRVKKFMLIYGAAQDLISAHAHKEYHRSIEIDTLDHQNPEKSITTFSFKELTTAEKIFLAQRSREAVEGYTHTTLSSERMVVEEIKEEADERKEEKREKISPFTRTGPSAWAQVPSTFSMDVAMASLSSVSSSSSSYLRDRSMAAVASVSASISATSSQQSTRQGPT